jgi:PII-like signaling protein
MQNYQPAKLLRLHFTERDRYRGKPLYEAIVQKCQELKIAGATVLRGLEGYGDTAEIHRSHILTHDLPIVVQIVDSEENIQRLLPILEEMMDKGLIAMSNVTVARIQKAAKDSEYSRRS